MLIDLVQLRTFVAVAEEQHLTRAAERLHVSSLAHQLESAFGKPDQTHAVMNASGAEAPLCDLEAAAFAEQDAVHRYADVLEIHLDDSSSTTAINGGAAATSDLSLLVLARHWTWV